MCENFFLGLTWRAPQSKLHTIISRHLNFCEGGTLHRVSQSKLHTIVSRHLNFCERKTQCVYERAMTPIAQCHVLTGRRSDCFLLCVCGLCLLRTHWLFEFVLILTFDVTGGDEPQCERDERSYRNMTI